MTTTNSPRDDEPTAVQFVVEEETRAQRVGGGFEPETPRRDGRDAVQMPDDHAGRLVVGAVDDDLGAGRDGVVDVRPETRLDESAALTRPPPGAARPARPAGRGRKCPTR